MADGRTETGSATTEGSTGLSTRQPSLNTTATAASTTSSNNPDRVRARLGLRSMAPSELLGAGSCLFGAAAVCQTCEGLMHTAAGGPPLVIALSAGQAVCCAGSAVLLRLAQSNLETIERGEDAEASASEENDHER